MPGLAALRFVNDTQPRPLSDAESATDQPGAYLRDAWRRPMLSVRGEGFKIFKHGETTQEYEDAAPLAALTPFIPKI